MPTLTNKGIHRAFQLSNILLMKTNPALEVSLTAIQHLKMQNLLVEKMKNVLVFMTANVMVSIGQRIKAQLFCLIRDLARGLKVIYFSHLNIITYN